jgi:hypothetical protein
MNGSRAPLLASFLVLDGLGVGAVLLDDGLGGGWPADVLALALVVAGMVLVLRMTLQYLDQVDNPTAEEMRADLHARRRSRRRAPRAPRAPDHRLAG